MDMPRSGDLEDLEDLEEEEELPGQDKGEDEGFSFMSKLV